MTDFVVHLKEQLLKEFQYQDRRGVYGFTQKLMAFNSNRIEGSHLAAEHTASLFDTGTIVTEGEFVYRAKDVEEMNGHFKVFNQVLKSLGAPLTLDMIKSFHFHLKTGVFEDYANGYPIGEFKSRANAVGTFITEIPQNVPSRLYELIQQYNSGPQLLQNIAEFHLKYECIHPFQDGNGRTGRAIVFKQCLDSNLLPAIILDEDKAIYYHALQTASVERLTAFFREEQDKYYCKIRPLIEQA